MDTPQFTDGQFVNAALLNAAVASVMADFKLAESELHYPGLISPSSLSLTPTGLTVSISAPSPFAVLFGSGLVVGAHGTANGADTSTYSVNLSSLVPGSGSQTVYVLAQYTQVGETIVTVVGPPPGHPDYDPAFSPFEFYTVERDSLSITAGLTAANNTTTFELFRVTLSAGQNTITAGQIITANQHYASSVLNPTGVGVGTYGPAIVTVAVDGRVISAENVGIGNGLAYASSTLSVNAGAGLQFIGGALALNQPHGFASFPTHGSGLQFTVPANVYWVTVYGTGAGGGSGSTDGTMTGGCGGGGGTFIKAYNVSPGQVLTFNVGAGGVAAASGHGLAGGNGGNTQFGSCVAYGGGGGSTVTPLNGGSSGTATGGDINLTGGYGSDGNIVTVSGINGSPASGLGGSTFWGGGGRCWSAPGPPFVGGQAPGSGAGAPYVSASASAVGADGIIVFAW